MEQLHIKPCWNIGYTTKEHLCIDLDNTSFFKVRRLALMIMKDYPQIGNCLIVKSSYQKLRETWVYRVMEGMKKVVKRHNYHLVFNNFIGYNKCCEIICNLADLGVINEQYTKIRQMRNDMTLRTSKTVCVGYVKQAPEIIELLPNIYNKKEDTGIKDYSELLYNS